MFFKKKPKYKEIDYPILAEAIEYTSGLNFKKETDPKDTPFGFAYGVIKIDDNITIIIDNYHYNYSHYSWGGFMGTSHYMALWTDTYVGDVKVNSYAFDKDLRSGYLHEWRLDKKEIYHKITNEMIDVINNWAKEIVSKKRKREESIRKAEEEKENQKHKKEEDAVNAIASLYKGD